MTVIMGIINLTPDSFYEPSRYDMSVLDSDADIVDIGAVSTRPGHSEVSLEEEWARLEPFLRTLNTDKSISIDTTRAEIVRRVYDMTGPFIVNDISAGEDDPGMLPLVGELGLRYIAMHRYPLNVDELEYFRHFDRKAELYGIDDWILDPGFGFNKDVDENLRLLNSLSSLKVFGRPVLVGVADKRFTRAGTGTEEAHLIALRQGAGILRVHDVKKARQTARLYEESLVKQTGHRVAVP